MLLLLLYAVLPIFNPYLWRRTQTQKEQAASSPLYLPYISLTSPQASSARSSSPTCASPSTPPPSKHLWPPPRRRRRRRRRWRLTLTLALSLALP